jgi:hypothetical protein
MSLRLAILLAASLLALGGCAQDELAVIGQILPTDIIFDAAAAAPPNDDVVALPTPAGATRPYTAATPKAPLSLLPTPAGATPLSIAASARSQRPP